MSAVTPKSSVVKNNYDVIDLFKLFFALMIMYMHCYCWDMGIIGAWVKDVISSLGVPFFFITSGFFYERGLNRAANQKIYCRSYLKRVITMYLLWTVLTIPVEIMVINAGHSDYSILVKLIYFVRSVVLAGPIGNYWYLLSLIYGAAILYCAKKNRAVEWLIYAAAVLMFVVGLLYDNSVLPKSSLIYRVIHIVFGSERNICNVGLFYLCVGKWFYDSRICLKRSWIWIGSAACLLLRTYEAMCLHTRYTHALLAVMVFLLAASADVTIKNAFQVRRYSTALYLMHFPAILLWDFFLKKGTVVNLLFVLAVCAVGYLFVDRVLPKKVGMMLFGK